jgi:Tfp pilus assembly protein PilV
MSSVRAAGGFTAVELLAAAVVFPIIVIGIANSYNSLRRSYMTSRQLNEMYAVLSACPEIDRALEYSSLSSTTNCYPNNIFDVENSSVGKITYAPNLTVTDTSSLSGSDPLRTIPDSKVINIRVGFPEPSSAPDLQLKILITRNGIGQL